MDARKKSKWTRQEEYGIAMYAHFQYAQTAWIELRLCGNRKMCHLMNKESGKMFDSHFIYQLDKLILVEIN